MRISEVDHYQETVKDVLGHRNVYHSERKERDECFVAEEKTVKSSLRVEDNDQ